jgi:chaperonin cofactor prefoldin
MEYNKSELQQEINTMQSLLDDANTSESTKAGLRLGLDAAKKILSELEKVQAKKAEDKPVPAAVVATAKARTKKAIKHSKEIVKKVKAAKKQTPGSPAHKKSIKELIAASAALTKMYAGATTRQLENDAEHKAKHPGLRTSSSGKKYYESRGNRSDLSTKQKPYLAKGGKLPGKLLPIGYEITIPSFGLDRNVKMKLIEIIPISEDDGGFSYHFKGSQNRHQYYTEPQLKNRLSEFGKSFAAGGPIGDGKNGYIAFYKGKQVEVMADSSYAAQTKAAAYFKAKKSYDVSVVLAEVEGRQITHSPMFAKGGSIKQKPKIFLQSIGKDVTEDNYDEGEEPGTSRAVFYETVNKEFSSSKELFDYLQRNYGLKADPKRYYAFEQGRLTYSQTEDNEGDEPSSSEMEYFKAGKINLWSADYDIYVSYSVIKPTPIKKMVEWGAEEYARGGSISEQQFAKGGKISKDEKVTLMKAAMLLAVYKRGFKPSQVGYIESTKIIDKFKTDPKDLENLRMAILYLISYQSYLKHPNVNEAGKEKTIELIEKVIDDIQIMSGNKSYAEGGTIDNAVKQVVREELQEINLPKPQPVYQQIPGLKAANPKADKYLSHEHDYSFARGGKISWTISSQEDINNAKEAGAYIERDYKDAITGTPNGEMIDLFANGRTWRFKKENNELKFVKTMIGQFGNESDEYAKGGQVDSELWHIVGRDAPPENFTPAAVQAFEKALSELQKEDHESAYYATSVAGLSNMINVVMALLYTDEPTAAHSMLQDVGIENYKSGMLVNTKFPQ